MLFKAQLTTENEKLQGEIKNLKAQITKFNQNESASQTEVKELKSKIQDLQRKLTEAELKGSNSNSSFDLEKSRLKSKLDETELEFKKLQRQNEMNLDQISSLRKDVSCLTFYLKLQILMLFFCRMMIFVANSTILNVSTVSNEHSTTTMQHSRTS